MDLSKILMLLSGLCWSIVYIEIIRLGFKYKTYGMPLFALALNFSWEFLYGFLGFTTNKTQQIVNIIWSCLDFVIIITFFLYGYRFFPKRFHKKQFITWGITVFVIAFIIQLLFYYQFPRDTHGESFSAFLQNFVMSLLFINMLVTRSSTQGQSITIGVAKWLGTLAPTVVLFINGMQSKCTFGTSLSIIDDSFCLPNWSWFLLVFGIFCSIFDILYIILLKNKMKETIKV